MGFAESGCLGVNEVRWEGEISWGTTGQHLPCLCRITPDEESRVECLRVLEQIRGRVFPI